MKLRRQPATGPETVDEAIDRLNALMPGPPLPTMPNPDDAPAWHRWFEAWHEWRFDKPRDVQDKVWAATFLRDMPGDEPFDPSMI